MFKQTYRRMYERIAPDGALVRDTVRQMEGESRPPRRVPRRAAAALAVLAVVLFTGGHVAARIPAGYELMYALSPALAQKFAPVQESCVSSGILMEVVGAYIRGNEADIYITMQDLEGDRIDASADLLDSYSIHRPFSSSATCRRLDFDEQTGKATFLISISEWGDHDIEGSKLTFSVGEILGGQKKLLDVPVELDLDVAGLPMQRVDLSGGSGLASGQDTAAVPAPGESLWSPGEGLYVSAAGYANGQLHIQLMNTEPFELDNHGYFYFVGPDGERVKCVQSYAVNEGSGEDRRSYYTFVFDIPQQDIGKYRLYGSFWVGGQVTEGDWRVTFPLTTSEE